MNYFIQRGIQEYGPYSLADLQRYVQQGNIALTDLARSEGMGDWAPVSQIVGNVAVPVGELVPGSAAGYAAQSLPAGEINPPPSLHWGILLLLSLVTCTIFS